MKIALVSPYDFSFPGGVTEHTVALATGLHRRGHTVQVLAACSGYHNSRYPHTHTVTRRVATLPIRGATARVGLSPLSYLRIKKILQQEAFDVIHLQEPLTPSITWWTLLSAYATPNAVTVGTFHAYHEQPNWLYQHARPIFRRIFARLNALIAVSEAAYRFANQMFPGEYHIIPNGIDLNRFEQKLSAEPNSSKNITILFVGRLDKRKGFPTLLEAFQKLQPFYPQLKLQVVGPFDSSTGRLYHTMAQNASNVEFMGYIPPERLPQYYHQADIFCAPSIGFESFGIVLLEAMAAGLPVVASNIMGYQSLVAHGVEGLLVPPENSNSLAAALRQLIDNPQCRRIMGQQGHLKAKQYSWDGVIDKTLQVYLDTINYTTKPQVSYTPSGMSNNHTVAHGQRRQLYHVKRSRTQVQS